MFCVLELTAMKDDVVFVPSERGNGFSKSFLHTGLWYNFRPPWYKNIHSIVCIYIYIYIYSFIFIYTHIHVDVDRSCIWKKWVKILMHIYLNTKRQISAATLQHTTVLYCTVTAEKALKHIVASTIRKWPHRGTFSISSRCCVNLWIKRTTAKKILLLLEFFSLFSFR
jgi:hypothetical protein